ncbi:MAG: transposase [Bdellovibrionota bacterium]
MVLFMRQESLFPGKFPVHHGGELTRGRRKCLRPLSCKRPVHFILKSRKRIYTSRRTVVTELQRQAEKFGIRVYDFAVAHDHFHFVARLPLRAHYVKFIRALCGVLARKLGAKLWAQPPFSRVATWGRDFRELIKYLAKNREEAAGRQLYEPRKDWYRRFRGKPD